MNPHARGILRLTLFVFLVSILVCLPFFFFGEGLFVPLLESLKQHKGWLLTGVVVLLALDAVLPVPSAWVLIFLALQAGVAAGVVGGSLGLSLGVLVSCWVGRVAVGRVAPKFIPEAEIARLRDSIQRNTTLTLACMRSVPVLAETSVMIAAAAGVPTWRIFFATLLPNIAIAAVYSLAADDSFLTACVAFFATTGISYVSWRVFGAVRSTPGTSRVDG